VSWNFAVPDWADRLKAGRSLMPDLPLDKVEAGRAVQIFDKLHLPDVPGQPTLKEAAGEWQRDIVRAIFGSLVDGNRMVPELFAMLPKKSGKTTIGAALTQTAMLMNVRPRAEMIYVGPDPGGRRHRISADRRHDRGRRIPDEAVPHRAPHQDDHRPEEQGSAEGEDLRHEGGDRLEAVLGAARRVAPDGRDLRRFSHHRPDQGRHAAESGSGAGDHHHAVGRAAGGRLQGRARLCPG
jgi:hypothetical protein